MFLFPVGKNTGNLHKILKACFYTRNLPPTHVKKSFSLQKIKGCARVLVGCFCDLWNFVVNFVFVNCEIERGYCDCSSQGTTFHGDSSGINDILIL